MIDYIKKYIFSGQAAVSHKEKFISGIMAFLVLLILVLCLSYFSGRDGLPYLVASMGAAAVLIFAVPHSPLSQPWPVMGGHIVSAFIGVACYQFVPLPSLSIALAVSLSITAMFYLRCLHPPGGAAALGAILGGPDIHDLGFLYVLNPVGLSIGLMLIFAILINRIISAGRYPTVSKKSSLKNITSEWALGTPRFNDSDLNQALSNMDSYIDVSQEDLARIYTLAVMNANKRRLGEVSCADIMSMNPIRFRFDDELEVAWKQLREQNLKAAPIVDAFDRPIGIVTINDFIRITEDMKGETLQEKLNKLLQRSPGLHADKVEVVGQIMSSPVTTADVNRHIIDLVAILTEQGFHHMPIVDSSKKLVGMITRSDIIKSLILTRT